jgi:hypothetical protein
VLIALGAIPPAVAGVLLEGLEIRDPWVVEACAAVLTWNPISLVVFAFDPPGGGFDHWYDPVYIVPIYLGASVVWLTLAVFAVRRTYVRAAGAGAASGSRLSRLNYFGFRRRRRAVGSHAMLWKELLSQQRAVRLGWIGRVASLLLFSGAYVGLGLSIWAMFEAESTASYNSYWRDYEDADPYGWEVPFHRAILHYFKVYAEALGGSFVLLLVTARAAGSITVEREQDSWITLISTPLEARSIALAKMAGAVYSVRYWYAFFVVTWIASAIRYPPFWYVLPVLLLQHLMFAWLCAATGVFFSARCKTSLWAIGSALATVVIVGGGLPLLCVAIIAFAGDTHGPPMAVGFIIPVCLGSIDVGIVEELSRGRSHGPDAEVYHAALVAHVVYFALGLFMTFIVDATFDSACGRLAASPYCPGRRPGGPDGDARADDADLPDDLQLDV